MTAEADLLRRAALAVRTGGAEATDDLRDIAGPLVALLTGIAEHAEHHGGQPQGPVLDLARAILGEPEAP